MTDTPGMILKRLARAAIVKAGGDTEKAHDEFNLKMMEANRADLERELCSAYRNTAIRAVLATHYQELRSEGKLPQLHKPTRIPTTNHDKPAEKSGRPSDFLWDDKEGMTPKAIIRRYLETFMVNGKPIGDCRVDEVDAAAGVRESDARFMRALVEGLPPEVIVRDHRTEEDAAKLWRNIKESPQELTAAE